MSSLIVATHVLFLLHAAQAIIETLRAASCLSNLPRENLWTQPSSDSNFQAGSKFHLSDNNSFLATDVCLEYCTNR